MNKKNFVSVLIILLAVSSIPVFAVNVGTYKTESEYGLLDGFKFNWKRKDKSIPLIEPREESTSKEKEKEMEYYKESEYERTRYMYDGKAII